MSDTGNKDNELNNSNFNSIEINNSKPDIFILDPSKVEYHSVSSFKAKNEMIKIESLAELKNDEYKKELEKREETIVQQKQEFTHKDGGWGWIVLISSTCLYGFLLSSWSSFVLFYPKFIDYYNATEENSVAYSAWIGSGTLGIQFITSAFSSILVDFFGALQVGIAGGLLSCIGMAGSAFSFRYRIQTHFVTYCLIFGFGQSLILSTCFSILPHYFNKKLGLVNGLMNTGGCFCVIVSSILIGQLLDIIGIVNVFYIISAVCLLLCAFSLVFKPQLPVEKNRTFKERVNDSLGLDIFLKPRFIIWVVASMLGIYGNITPVITMNFSVAYCYLSSYFVYGVATVFIQYTDDFILYCIIICLYGIFDGLFLCSLLPMAFETAESSKLVNQALGYYNTLISFTMVAGPSVSGLLFEKFDNYNLAYDIASGLSFLAALILTFYPKIGLRKLNSIFKTTVLKRKKVYVINS